ncbi:hypothetical protein [Streptomyces sp. RerS4]|uniref:hypothetical protein n=1 Tax=Streptomyces sp. RerS4 TaxID=2942449 RepID=UPI00201BC74E|nr:hypothetical protein [Streptomyces sp. RerS4]UQW99186.1 hypothetical protein M4D82_00500 [Streptomyces sp. RerS4]
MNAYRTAAPHRPAEDPDRIFDGRRVVHCPDCHWAQGLNKDLHLGPWALLYWHRSHPADAVDHLAEMPDRLAIPAYVEWGWQAHWLAINDTRTEEGFVLLGTEDLEVFRSVSADGGLDQAVLANTRRRSVFPSAARAEIEAAASDLFRTGLLRPAPGL